MILASATATTLAIMATKFWIGVGLGILGGVAVFGLPGR